jgi:hypothetical protein
MKRFNIGKLIANIVGLGLAVVIGYFSFNVGKVAYAWGQVKFPDVFIFPFVISLIAGLVVFLTVSAIVLLPLERFYRSL